MLKTTKIIQHFIRHKSKGGLAVMAVHVEGNSYIDVATAICSVQDQYNKKVAVRMLENSFTDNQTIRLPIGNALRHRMTHRSLRDWVLCQFCYSDPR